MAYNSNFDVLQSGKIILFCIVVLIALFLAQVICILASGQNTDVIKNIDSIKNGDIIGVFHLLFNLVTYSIIPFPLNLVPLIFTVVLSIIIVAFVINELLALIPSWL